MWGVQMEVKNPKGEAWGKEYVNIPVKPDTRTKLRKFCACFGSFGNTYDLLVNELLDGALKMEKFLKKDKNQKFGGLIDEFIECYNKIQEQNK
jgi:7,8-dihydro-6-hydroxymethylpterin-pyrophosphokinase